MWIKFIFKQNSLNFLAFKAHIIKYNQKPFSKIINNISTSTSDEIPCSSNFLLENSKFQSNLNLNYSLYIFL